MAAPAEKHVTVAAAPPGYTAVPVRLRARQRAPHYLYVKEHRVQCSADPARPPGRTLLVLNVPPYCPQECLSRLFSRCGAVQSVQVCEKPGPGESAEVLESKFFNLRRILGFRVAYVVFKNPSRVQAAISLSPHEPLLMSSESCPVKTGILKWISCYAASLVNPEELKAEVDTFMQAYDQKVAEEEAKAVEEEGVPDEEGWVKVTRKGRRPGLPRTEAANLRALEREKRKKARKELLNFYAWQHRETKREHIAQLRKKFEEDKQRIALMQAQRKFRPY
ncbi:ribosomal RNA-processing protein 7 homolog A [Alligator mississippiensis]|uniref:Ribosomal RNA-processing 7-like protein A n=1 Tax=Alligator mississippiensis TaxID=8496 RepID=A0A151LYX6_ALLMI|nr:ribosomal RNA-processing protein 7 homolog A [Alligator mississippiensis]KYO17451.1 ribosomal RNA-processing 7-like protein A [Alligator mississippiensis]